MALFSSSSSCSVLVLVLLSFSAAAQSKDILVGGKTDAWKVPSSESDSLNKWAEKSRFRIGDSLVWKYDGSKDSVLQVSQADYVKCNTTSPIESYKDGNTKVKLEKSGPYFFISGVKEHCEKGQKLHVVVLSERHRWSMAPAPSPDQYTNSIAVAPAVAPTSSATTTTNVAAGFVVALVAMGWFLF